MHKFAIKPEIYYSQDAAQSLACPQVKRVFIIADPVMLENGRCDTIEGIFKTGNDVVFAYYSNIKPDPTLDLITEGAALAWNFRPDLIIALGGGSAIDEAKVIKSIYSKIAGSADQAFSKPIFAAIPTTSGTGSEVTNLSVITINSVKTVLADDDFLPDIAIIDVAFTRTLPLQILADTAADALTHALEALISSRSSYCSDALAEKAVKLVFDGLREIFVDGDSIEARSRLHHASCIAGMAFANASLGINHSMAHAFSSLFHVPHGRSNAVFLTKTLSFNMQKPYVSEKLAVLSRELGFSRRPAERDETDANRLLVRIERLLRICGIPASVSELDIDQESYVEQITAMTQMALTDRCTPTNPVPAEKKDFIRLFIKAY